VQSNLASGQSNQEVERQRTWTNPVSFSRLAVWLWLSGKYSRKWLALGNENRQVLPAMPTGYRQWTFSQWLPFCQWSTMTGLLWPLAISTFLHSTTSDYQHLRASFLIGYDRLARTTCHWPEVYSCTEKSLMHWQLHAAPTRASLCAALTSWTYNLAQTRA